MRKKAVVTESSKWFAALGLKTLKEQETTLWERIGRDGAQLSDETMIFLYGSKNEIDGLAALGKYLTIFLPNSLFCEDGCRTIKLGKWQGNASEKSESRFSLEHIFETCHRLHEKHRKAYNIMRSYCRHYFWLRQKSQRYRDTSCYSCRILHVWF